ncbi:MAG: tyrosine recombinase [Candidatus Margulisbacteria bacterium]|jgi:integrase/recombinase XerD|nr:tyrosine recombinase [Candidatus Margulisiibacteriota bacterium]
MNALQYLNKFLEYLLYERGYSPLTVEAYGCDLRRFVQKHPDYLALERRTLEDYAGELCGLEHSSVARKLAAVKAFYKFLYQEEIIPQNPAAGLALPKLARRLPKALSKKETQRLLALDKELLLWRDLAVLELLYSAGLRVSELTSIKLTDIDLAECFVKVCGKGSKERLVPLGSRALAALRKYLELERNGLPDPEPELFLSRRGRRLTRQRIWQMVKKTAALTGVIKNVSPHTFRHSLATHLIENGADIRTVQEILGHASIATTQIYTSVSREHLRRVYARAFPERG